MKTAIIVNTRLNSSRIPRKAAHLINGLPILKHLHNRLIKTGLRVIYAVPKSEKLDYIRMFDKYKFKQFSLYCDVKHGRFANDPLARMKHAAEWHPGDIDTIIRCNHDKVFVDAKQIHHALDIFKSKKLDYLYSSDLTPGTGFEILSFNALEKAANKFKDVEHLGYALKAVTDNTLDLGFMAKDVRPHYRLLIDFPEDLELMTMLFAILGDDCTLQDVIRFLDVNPWALDVNKKPKLTVYTCAYNPNINWLKQCMFSVQEQYRYDMEYILIDDGSNSETAKAMAEHSVKYSNTKYIRNDKNIGLASSSNIALARARGDYIIRIDADDYLSPNALKHLVREIEDQQVDVVYPNNFHGSLTKIQNGNEQNHAGGAIFSTRALNHLKFTEGLRNHDSLDIFTRAKDQLKIGYYDHPTFFYRQHDKSMSKTNLKEREITKEAILGQV